MSHEQIEKIATFFDKILKVLFFKQTPKFWILYSSIVIYIYNIIWECSYLYNMKQVLSC